MKRIFFVFVLLSLLFVTGCVKETKEISISDGETQVDIKTDINDNSLDWCQEGATWSMSSSGEENANVNMVIQGIVTEGKYKGYCHVTYDVTSEENTANMDFYYDEDGNGYQVMNVEGNVFESSWTKPN